MRKWIIGVMVIDIVIVVLPLYCCLVVAKKEDEEIERFFQNDGKKIENFYHLHNLEVDRLIGHKNLSSIAI